MQKLIKEVDFYYDTNGLMVFTALYHQKRGFCCGNGCRHCPYQHAAVSPTSKLQPVKAGQNSASNASDGCSNQYNT